jgi:hypothetical protein
MRRHALDRRIASASAFGSGSRNSCREKEQSFSFPVPLMQDMQFGGFMMQQQPFQFGDRSSRKKSEGDDVDGSSGSMDDDDYEDDDDDSGDSEDEMKLELYAPLAFTQCIFVTSCACTSKWNTVRTL